MTPGQPADVFERCYTESLAQAPTHCRIMESPIGIGIDRLRRKVTKSPELQRAHMDASPQRHAAAKPSEKQCSQSGVMLRLSMLPENTVEI